MAAKDTGQIWKDEPKFGVDNVRLSDGSTVRFIEVYGRGVAEMMAKLANESLPEGYEARVIPV